MSKEDSPDVFVMGEDDQVELGPFKGAGLDMKGSALMAIYRFPTVRQPCACIHGCDA